MKHGRTAMTSALIAVLVTFVMFTRATSAAATIPDPQTDDMRASAKGQRVMVLAGGCFWGMEEVFEHVRGVTDVVSGYAGGAAAAARYEMVETGTTGHAESVRITYDPSRITYGQLLKVYFSVAHDPTQKNAQWPDSGPQYRSVIFYMNDRQQQIAKAYIAQLDSAHVYRRPIVTEVTPLPAFYMAEAYHQDFARLHPDHRYITQIDRPKMDAFKTLLPALYVN